MSQSSGSYFLVLQFVKVREIYIQKPKIPVFLSQKFGHLASLFYQDSATVRPNFLQWLRVRQKKISRSELKIGNKHENTESKNYK